MKILVTGGAGFIGSVLAHRLIANGHEVCVSDELGRDAKFLNLAGAAISDYFEKEELADRLAGKGAMPALDAIAHLGACSATTEPDGSYLMRNNLGYSKLVATYALEKKVRLVYASSAATYGAGEHGYDDDPAILPKFRPLNKYALSKHLFDLWASANGALATIVGVKYFNVFGPHEYHKGDMRSVALKAYEQIEKGGPVKLFRSHRKDYAHGEQQRDFLYVKDAVAITEWLVERRDVGGIFNIGSGTARTWNDLVRAVFAALGKKPKIEYVAMPGAIRDAYQYTTCASMERLAKAGCPLRARPLEESVRDYVAGHLASGRRWLGT